MNFSSELQILIFSAITVACLHTLTGPDHYVPFVALSKSRGWTYSKTIAWTVLCGCGHVWSSVLLGLGGAALGWSLQKIDFFENFRGSLASWGLLVFGLIYMIWGFYNAFLNKTHKHFDVELSGEMYVYEHRHGVAVAPKERHKVTPWVMFIIFLLGPCEPMIPLLFAPAVKNSWTDVGLLILIYTVITLLTMLGMVTFGFYGFSLLKTQTIERYMHALGGLTLVVCGLGMIFMGW